MKYLILISFFVALAAASEIPAGAKLTVAFDRPEYFIGENVTVRVVLENVGKETFSAISGDFLGTPRNTHFAVTATDATGHLAEDPAPNQVGLGGRVVPPQILRPGEHETFTLLLSSYCRILKPGRYLIRVSRDFGWTPVGKQSYPAGEATLTLKMPNPTEAEHIVEEMEKPRFVSTPFVTMVEHPDFSSLQLPAYLPALLRRARTGDLLALAGIASIATPEATAGMIELANESEGAFALQISGRLVWRMPFRQHWGWLSRGGTTRARLIALAWDDRLTPAVHRLAEKWLALGNPLFIGAAGELLTSVGTVADAPAVFRVLDRQMVPLVQPRELVATTSELPKPLPQLSDFISVLCAEGYVLDENTLQGDGQILAYFRMFRPETPRSPTWRRLLETYAHDPNFALREAAIHSIPYPAPPDCVALVDNARSDPDAGVRSAAFFVTEHKVYNFNASPNGPPQFISIPLPPDSK